MVVGLPTRTGVTRPDGTPGRSGMVDRLYAVPPERFAAERRAAVAGSTAVGDHAGAAYLAALPSPTVAAWMVNLLALRRPDLIDELDRLAGRLRKAQRDLDGARLRELTLARRRLVAVLTTQARRLALAAGRPARARLALADVEATLCASLADPAVAAAVRAGRLSRAASYSGFGEVPRPRLRLVDSDPASRATAPAAAVVSPATGRSGEATVLPLPTGRSPSAVTESSA